MDVIQRFHQACNNRQKEQHLVIAKLLAHSPLALPDYMLLAELIREHKLSSSDYSEINNSLPLLVDDLYPQPMLVWLQGLLCYYYASSNILSNQGLQALISSACKNFAPSQYELGLIYQARNHQQHANRWWQAAANTYYEPALLYLGQIAIEQQQWRIAQHWLNQLQKRHYAPALTLLGVLAANHRQLDDAIMLYYLAASKGESIALVKLAEYFILFPNMQGDLQTASSLLREAIPFLNSFWKQHADSLVDKIKRRSKGQKVAKFPYGFVKLLPANNNYSNADI